MIDSNVLVAYKIRAVNYRVSNSELAVDINSLVGIVTARDLQTSLLTNSTKTVSL